MPYDSPNFMNRSLIFIVCLTLLVSSCKLLESRIREKRMLKMSANRDQKFEAIVSNRLISSDTLIILRTDIFGPNTVDREHSFNRFILSRESDSIAISRFIQDRNGWIQTDWMLQLPFRFNPFEPDVIGGLQRCEIKEARITNMGMVEVVIMANSEVFFKGVMDEYDLENSKKCSLYNYFNGIYGIVKTERTNDR